MTTLEHYGIKNDKSKTSRVNELRKRNDEISNINNQADVRVHGDRL